MVERLVRRELDGREKIRRRLARLALLGEVVAELVFHERDVRVELVGPEQDRRRLLALADLAEQVAVGGVARGVFRVAAQQ